MDKNNKCTIYIDEAGDLGLNRGTTWFVLSAVIVNKDEEKQIRTILNNIKSTLNIKVIHFSPLRHFEKRAYVANELSKCNFQHCHVLVDTTKVTFTPRDPNASKSVLLYNYTCRYLLERVSWLLRDTNRCGEIVLSSRGTSRDNELIEYINNVLLKNPNNNIVNLFTKTISKTASSWDMLQLADVCATSMFMCHEINAKFGFLMPCFAHRLGHNIYSYKGKLINYGMKYFSQDMEPEKDYFSINSPCLKK